MSVGEVFGVVGLATSSANATKQGSLTVGKVPLSAMLCNVFISFSFSFVFVNIWHIRSSHLLHTIDKGIIFVCVFILAKVAKSVSQ